MADGMYRKQMSKVIAITNKKGGCGKSFTTASLGFALARKGKRVLCIDARQSTFTNREYGHF